jgi:hypothetical protein
MAEGADTMMGMTSDAAFAYGDDLVNTDLTRGHVVDIREANGQILYGLASNNAKVTYYVETSLRSADGML